MQKFLIILFFLIPTYFYCQTPEQSADSLEKSKLDDPKDTIKELKFQKYFFVSFGSGLGKEYLDPEALSTLNFENEISYIFSQFFSSGISIYYGKESNGKYSFLKGNIGVYVQPIKLKKVHIKVGGGLSFIDYSEFTYGYWNDYLGNLHYDRFKLIQNSSFGINYLLECSYLIKKKFSLGAKLNFQQYQNGLSSSGILINLGFKL